DVRPWEWAREAAPLTQRAMYSLPIRSLTTCLSSTVRARSLLRSRWAPVPKIWRLTQAEACGSPTHAAARSVCSRAWRNLLRPQITIPTGESASVTVISKPDLFCNRLAGPERSLVADDLLDDAAANQPGSLRGAPCIQSRSAL